MNKTKEKKKLGPHSTEMHRPESHELSGRAAHFKRQSLVNMCLPSGKLLSKGKECFLESEDFEYLKNVFGEGVNLIVE